MPKERRQYKKWERKQQVLWHFEQWHDRGNTEPKTMYEIAKVLDLVPSQHVHSILIEMVESGDLTFSERDQSGRWTTRFYALSTARTLSRVVLKRRVVVKHKGVVSGQLEMAL